MSKYTALNQYAAATVLILLCSAVISAEGLVEKARARQAQAEATLAAGRQARLSQRAELAAQRSAATRELSLLSQRRRDLEAALSAQATELAATRQRVQQRSLMVDRLRESLTTAYGVDTTDQVPAALERLINELRLAAQIRVSEESIVGRLGQVHHVPVLRIGAVVAYAVGENDATCGLLLESVGSKPRVAGPHFSETRRSALQDLIGGDAGALPADVDGSLTTLAPIEAWTLSSWIADGGLFAWPILLVTLLALAISSERVLSLLRLRAPHSLAERTLNRLTSEGPEAARSLVNDQGTPMARVLDAGLKLAGAGRARLEAGLEAALLTEEPRFERSLTLLAACAAVAPLLGLLGTVTGMIGTFEVIAVHGTGNPRLLSGGISEALVTTQMGLLAAVPILLCHATLSRVVDRRQVRLEQAATALVACCEEEE